MELGYYMIPRFRKYRYMREAFTSLFDIQLLENMCFKRDGTLRDHHELNEKFYDDYIFSILNKEWYNRSQTASY